MLNALQIRDRTGSYTAGFTALILLSLIGTIAVGMLPCEKTHNDPLRDLVVVSPAS